MYNNFKILKISIIRFLISYLNSITTLDLVRSHLSVRSFNEIYVYSWKFLGWKESKHPIIKFE